MQTPRPLGPAAGLRGIKFPISDRFAVSDKSPTARIGEPLVEIAQDLPPFRGFVNTTRRVD